MSACKLLDINPCERAFSRAGNEPAFTALDLYYPAVITGGRDGLFIFEAH